MDRNNRVRTKKDNYQISNILRNELPSFPQETLYSEFQGSGVNSTLLYYKFVFEEVQKKTKILEEELKMKNQIITKQKQDIMDMENQKHTLICDHEETVREFRRQQKYENKMEEQIVSLAEFLSRVLTPLNSEVEFLKTQKEMIKCFIIKKYQQLCSELEGLENYYTEKLSTTINNVDIMKQNKILMDESDNCLKFCMDKKQRLRSLINISNIEYKNLQEEDFNYIKMEADAQEEKNRLLSKILQVKSRLTNIITQFQVFQNELKNEFSSFLCNIDKLKLRFNYQQNDAEIVSVYEHKQNEVCTLSEFYENMKNTVEELKSRKTTFSKEIEKIQYLLNIKETEIHGYELMQQNQVKDISSIEEKLSSCEANNNALENGLYNMQCEYLQSERVLNSLKEKLSLLTTQYTVVSEHQNKLESQCNDVIKDIKNLDQDLQDLDLENQKLCKRMNEGRQYFENANKVYMINSVGKNEQVLQTYLRIEEEENLRVNVFVESDINSLLSENCQILSNQEYLELLIAKESANYRALIEKLKHDEKIFKDLSYEQQEYENLVKLMELKLARGKYINLIELNRKLCVVTNAVMQEREKVVKLEKELEILKNTEKGYNKRKLFKSNTETNVKYYSDTLTKWKSKATKGGTKRNNND